MIRDDYTAWDECPDVDNCELIQSFLELVDSMVKDIQHLMSIPWLQSHSMRYREPSIPNDRAT